MGQDKAGLLFNGHSLLSWQKQRLAALGLPVYHSGPTGFPDAQPGYLGPLAGMVSAARAEPAITTWLVVPVDMPRVSPAVLRPLLETAERERCPVAYQSYPLPLALPVSREQLEQMDAWLADPDGPRSIRHLHQSFHGLWLPTPHTAEELINLNTPEDWRRFLAASGFPAGDSA